MKSISLLLAAACFLVACGSSAPDDPPPPPDDDQDVPAKVDVQHAKTTSISTSPSGPTGH